MSNYHNITTDDMKNGEGLRVVLWMSGCNHHCKGCHNKVTWDPNDGLPIDDSVFGEIIDKLGYDHISGLTLSGGDPFHPDNIETTRLLSVLKLSHNNKTLWIYTGYLWEDIIKDPKIRCILQWVDVIVDGEYMEELADVHYKWAGSTNQRVIDVQKSLKEGQVILYESN